jgi:RimJ/RimL family protein N-acetyltransferase
VLFARKPTLVGDRVLLRPFTAPDVDAMGPVLADPEVLRLTGSVHSTAEIEAAVAVLDDRTREWYATREAQPDRLDLALVDRASDRCVGEVVLNDWRPEDQTCGFRVLVGPGGRDRGLGSEATRLVVAHAFAATDLHRIELEVFAFNPRAQHVYERTGFRVEGRRREAHVFDGQRFDAVVMAVLRPEAEPSGRSARPGPPAAADPTAGPRP